MSKFGGARGKFINFVEIGGICIIGLGGWAPLGSRVHTIPNQHQSTLSSLTRRFVHFCLLATLFGKFSIY